MPRYYFDIVDQGIIEVDEIGREFPNLAAAVADRKRAAREMAEEALPGTTIASVTVQIREGGTPPVVTVLARLNAP